MCTASSRSRSLLEATVQAQPARRQSSPRITTVDRQQFVKLCAAGTGRSYSPRSLHSAATKRCPDSTQVSPLRLAPDDRQQPLTPLVGRLARGDCPRAPKPPCRGLLADPVDVPLVAVARLAAPGRRARTTCTEAKRPRGDYSRDRNSVSPPATDVGREGGRPRWWGVACTRSWCLVNAPRRRRSG